MRDLRSAVLETGASLASARTIAVDARDTAGGGGQVVATNVGGVSSGERREVLPGLLAVDSGPARAGGSREDLAGGFMPAINDDEILY